MAQAKQALREGDGLRALDLLFIARIRGVDRETRALYRAIQKAQSLKRGGFRDTVVRFDDWIAHQGISVDEDLILGLRKFLMGPAWGDAWMRLAAFLEDLLHLREALFELRTRISDNPRLLRRLLEVRHQLPYKVTPHGRRVSADRRAYHPFDDREGDEDLVHELRDERDSVACPSRHPRWPEALPSGEFSSP